MSNWSLSKLFANLHDDVQQKLGIARTSFEHPGTKGDASQDVWIDVFRRYLPNRYQASTVHVVDSDGVFSDQIDIAIFDRQYTPFIFEFNERKIIPAEGVYAIFEVKQTANKDHVTYAQKKISSVRKLKRTSIPIPHAGGTYPPKPLTHIIGGLLALESDWSPPMGDPLADILKQADELEKIDLCCIASHGYVSWDKSTREYIQFSGEKSATSFLLELISELQNCGTVPMIDIMNYAQWLNK